MRKEIWCLSFHKHYIGKNMNKFKWLHISDLHFKISEGFDISFTLNSLKETLKEETKNGKFKYIFITGDVADCYDYSLAQQRIKELLMDTEIIEDKENIFWVCGNHDIPRTLRHRKREIADIRDKDQQEVTFESEFADDESRSLLIKAFDGYYQNRENILGMKKKGDYPHQIIHTDDVEIVMLNTCITSCDDNDEHQLYLCEPQLISLFDCIKGGKPVFVLGHHSLDYLVDSDKRRIMKLFSNKKITAYLCGHSHQLGVHPLTEDILEIVSGGFNMDGYSVMSCLVGTYDTDRDEYSLIPYVYRPGSMNWGIDYYAVSGIDGNKKYQVKLSVGEKEDESQDIVARFQRMLKGVSQIEKIDVESFNQVGLNILRKYVEKLLELDNSEQEDFSVLCEQAIQNGSKNINYPSLQMTMYLRDIWRFRDNFNRVLRELEIDNVTVPVFEAPIFDFNDFFEKVNRFNTTENTYVLVADALHDVSNQDKSSITELQWDVIFDYDGYSEQGGLRSNTHRQNIKDLSGNYGIIRESVLRRGTTSWIHIGEKMIFSLDDEQPPMNLREMKDIFSEVTRKLYENSNGDIIFVFIKRPDVLDKELMKIVWDRFSERARFVMLGAYDKRKIERELQNIFLDSRGKAVTDCYDIYQISMAHFFRKYSEHSEDFLEIKKYDSMQFPADNGLVKLNSNLYVNLEDYFEVLISDIGMDLEHQKEELESFYLGGQAAWSLFYTKKILELMDHEIYKIMINKIKTVLGAKQENPRQAIFYLLHDAGFGGTTTAKSIAWKMHKEYPTLILKHYEYGKIKPLIQNLYDNHSRKGVFLIADESSFSISELENLENEMGLVDRPYALLVVRRLGPGMRGKAQNTYKLNSLTRETVGILKSRFENQSNLTNEILKYKNEHFDEVFPKNSGMRCPFLIGLYYQDEQFNGVPQYVKRIIERVDSEPELDFLLILSIINCYGRIGVTKDIVRKYIPLSVNSDYLEKYPYAKDAFIGSYDETLQVKLYREKHNLISRELIKQCSEKLFKTEYQENLRNVLEKLIIKLLEINSNGVTLYYKTLFERLFIYKNAIDVDENGYTNVSEFSPLILALPSQESKEEVMCMLAEGVKKTVDQISVTNNELYFKMAAHICGHMGRLYKASTASLKMMENSRKSIEWCEVAESIMKRGGFEDAYIYHMYGTSLSKQCQDQLNAWKDSPEQCTDAELERLEGIMEKALNKFDDTIFAGELIRGYVSKLSLLMTYMQFLVRRKKINNSDELIKLSSKERNYMNDINSIISELGELVLDSKDQKRLLNLSTNYNSGVMFNNYGKAIEYYTNTINNVVKQKGEDAQELYILRSGLVGAILGKYHQDGKDPYTEMKEDDVARVLDNLEKNVFSTVVISDRWEQQRRCNDCHRWLKVAKQSTVPVQIGIKVAEKWKEIQSNMKMLNDPRPFYYLAVLYYLNALDGYSESSSIALGYHKQAYKIACNNAQFRLIKAEKIRDILVAGKGMGRIKGVVNMVEILSKDTEKMIRMQGKFINIVDEKNPKNGKIRILFPYELKNIMVYFKMGDKNTIGINQSTHMLEFGVGFTFERLEAINNTVRDINNSNGERCS